jgi:hypothetical protein
MVAEPWKTIVPTMSSPNDYHKSGSLKAVVLMTDGKFNSEQFSSQGDSDQQARAMCDAIKANGDVLIYTVAFQAPEEGKAVLEYCATTPSFAFQPDDAAALSEAYANIASSLTNLRIKY